MRDRLFNYKGPQKRGIHCMLKYAVAIAVLILVFAGLCFAKNNKFNIKEYNKLSNHEKKRALFRMKVNGLINKPRRDNRYGNQIIHKKKQSGSHTVDYIHLRNPNWEKAMKEIEEKLYGPEPKK